MNKMKSLVVWKKDTFSIVYLNKKYSLYNDEKLIIGDYDSLTPCSDAFFIGCIKDNLTYKYQLLNINGDKIFDNNKMFDLISFNQELRKFTFYDYYNKIDLMFPEFSGEKNKIFLMFLNKIYSKKITDICEFQIIVDEICKKIDNLTNEDIEKIIKNLELINKLYISLNKPVYLKDHLIVLDEEEEKEILNVIYSNKNTIFKELTKDIIRQPKIYELNENIINNIISTEQITNLNQVLTGLNNIRIKFETQMKYYETSRNEIFASLESIKNYFQNKETIKYFDKNDFNYIKKNKNLFLNIMFNNKNTDILNLLKYYDIT